MPTATSILFKGNSSSTPLPYNEPGLYDESTALLDGNTSSGGPVATGSGGAAHVIYDLGASVPIGNVQAHFTLNGSGSGANLHHSNDGLNWTPVTTGVSNGFVYAVNATARFFQFVIQTSNGATVHETAVFDNNGAEYTVGPPVTPSPTGAPTLSADINSEPGHIHLSWTAVATATGYELWRTTDGVWPGVKTYDGAELTFDDGLVSYDTTYSYRVLAKNANPTPGPWSNVVAVSPLPAVSITSITLDAGKPRIWHTELDSPPARATGRYEYGRSTLADGSDRVLLGLGTDNTKRDDTIGTPVGQTVYYWVRWYNTSNVASAWSPSYTYVYNPPASGEAKLSVGKDRGSSPLPIDQISLVVGWKWNLSINVQYGSNPDGTTGWTSVTVPAQSAHGGTYSEATITLAIAGNPAPRYVRVWVGDSGGGAGTNQVFVKELTIRETGTITTGLLTGDIPLAGLDDTGAQGVLKVANGQVLNTSTLPTAGGGWLGGTAGYTPPAHISGLNIEWVTAQTLRVKAGSAYIQGSSSIVTLAADVVTPTITIPSAAWYYVYLYDNAGTPSIEVSTTAPAAPYHGTARSKTGDTSRRYLGSVRAIAASRFANFLKVGTRTMYREDLTSGSVTFRMLNNGGATSATNFSVSSVVPPTSRTAWVHWQNLTATLGLIDTDDGTGTGSVANTAYMVVNANAKQVAPTLTNASQQIRYRMQSAATGLYADIMGYEEER